MDLMNEPQASVESTPLKPVYEAIAKKQDKIKTSDDIREGNSNLFYSASRALLDLGSLISKIYDAIAKKQDTLPNSDSLREGPNHLFYTDERVKTVIGLAVGDSFAKLSSHIKTKQDVIESSDHIEEGSKNLYFSKERALEALHPHLEKISNGIAMGSISFERSLSDLNAVFNTQAVIIAKLSNRIVALETKEAPVKEKNTEFEDFKKDFEDFKAQVNQKVDASYNVPGASHRIKVMVDVGKFQEIEIRGGQVTRVLPVK